VTREAITDQGLSARELLFPYVRWLLRVGACANTGRSSKLTLFLSQPGAPLDNNICERALKKAILHRKNALFYKTQHGADVGDLFMSLIQTAELSNVDPFDYLVQLRQWMPWNYRDTLAALNTGPDPPP
jgi:hypothetical protein